MPFPQRTWPNKIITQAPIWASSDLRDGNQAIRKPMDVPTKLAFFERLCAIGFKEIEVGFPSASDIDFEVVRTLIQQDLIPKDVCIGGLTAAVPEQIDKTIEALAGARRANIHVFVGTSPQFRDTVFKMSKTEIMAMAITHVRYIKEQVARYPETEWVLQFSPEAFSQTELPFICDVCNAVVDVWGATPENKIILNLPATVEACSPNQYADMIEWVGSHLEKRDSTVMSLHTHNDRGMAVAAAEMGLLAGADRVEGCLLGNGERTGNMDLVTLALNLYTQGVDPKLDFSNLEETKEFVESCTGIPTHARHPYAGDLVFTAYSGTHQGAIRKGLAAMEAKTFWDVPYLLIDPKDIGYGYDKLIRVNSQSGKGGVAHQLQTHYGVVLPKAMEKPFSLVVQKEAEATGAEVDPQRIWEIFHQEYLNDPSAAVRYVGHTLCDRPDSGLQGVSLTVAVKGQERTFQGEGNGPIDAAVHALALPVDVRVYEERSLGEGSNAPALAWVEMAVKDQAPSFFGAGLNDNTVTASIQAVVSAVNQAIKQGAVDITVPCREARPQTKETLKLIV